MRFFQHPLFLVGFRPFFLLAFVSAAVLPLFWVALYAGFLPWTSGGLDATRWHGHEMFFGFGGALLAGFLLTASKNWVNIRGLHGAPLFVAVLLWCADRVVMIVGPGSWGWVFGDLFFAYVMGYLVFTMVKHRAQDFFGDNFLFWLTLPLFLVAKHLVLNPDTYVQGIAVTTGLFRVAFVIMFERTMAQFMKNAMNCPLPRWPWLDYGIKISMFLSVGAVFLPAPFAAGLLAVATALLGFRFLIWKPQVGVRNFGIAVMYLGYLGLTLHLGLESWTAFSGQVGLGALSLHVFTFFCMGMIIPSMMIRISQGHTGRKPLFTGLDRLALGMMLLAGISRVIFTQVWPEYYLTWVGVAGLGWSGCFAVLGFRLGPFLWAPRIDGREH